jgi:hypothetical protein
MVAGLLAAYVSTMSTHLNWGTSYLVHDLYRRFIRPTASEAHYVLTGRVVTGLLMVVAALLTYVLDTASGAFQLLLSIGAGTGLLYLLRWYWWRINAWAEIAAMTSSFAVALLLFTLDRRGAGLSPHLALIASVAITTAVWIAVTFGTRPTDAATLRTFYARVRPAGPGWKQVRAGTDLPPSPDSLTHALTAWVLGCVTVYAALFGTGALLYGRTTLALVWGVVFAVGAGGLTRLLPHLWGRRPTGPAGA